MKTIAPKDAFKLFVFLLILFSAKTFANPKLPVEGNSTCGSKFGEVKKTSTVSETPKQSKNIAAVKSNKTSKMRLKVAVSK